MCGGGGPEALWKHPPASTYRTHHRPSSLRARWDHKPTWLPSVAIVEKYAIRPWSVFSAGPNPLGE